MTALRTARLVLRPKEAGDVDAIHAMVSEWEVVRWTASWPWPPERAFTEERVRGGQPDGGLIATVLRDGEVIGMASVVRAELGYMLAPAAWGQGFATEACTALLDFGFATTGWPAIEAGVFTGNDASLRVLNKLGFVRVGQDVSHCRALGRDVPGVELSLSRPAWSTIRASASE
jgi:RimJ/RimL family protein N-acetyltransferase